ncbi:MAG: hypothetical protein R3A79_13090 [Nannocystaceae bacterium]
MSALDELVAELRADGDVDSQGRFTLDPAKAREKMRRFQLADPRRYVLELVQAARLRGATRIDFRIDADDMWMRFDGRPFRAEELESLYSSLFADGDDPDLQALRQLALGLNAAMGMAPKRAQIHSGDAAMELRVDGEDRIAANRKPDDGTLIHVKQAARLGLILDFFRNAFGRLGEERHIIERCAYAGIDITLDGRPVSAAKRSLGGAVVELEFASGERRGIVGLRDSDAAAELRLVKDGVWISSEALSDELPGMLFVVEDPRLRKDVSQAKIVHDASYEAVRRSCADLRWRLLEALYARFQASGAAEPGPAERRLFTRALEAYATSETLAAAPVLRSLAAFYTWPEARGMTEARISLADLADDFAAHGSIQCATRRFPTLPPTGRPVAALAQPDDARWLESLFGYGALERPDLARELRRREGHARFRERATPLRLIGLGPELASMTLADGRGALALARKSEESVFLLVKDGCLLCRKTAPQPLRGLRAILAADLEPAEFFDDVVADERLAATVLDAVAAAVDMMPAALDAGRDEVHHSAQVEAQTRGRGRVKAYLAAVVDPATPRQLLRHFGFTQRDEALIERVAPRLLPALGVGRCPGDAPHPLARAPLFFPAVGGDALSLVDVAGNLKRVGAIRYVERDVKGLEGTSIAGDILRVGRGDAQILAGVFGQEALLASRDAVLSALHEREFMAAAMVDLEAIAAARGAPGLPFDLSPDLRALLTRRFDDGEGRRGLLTLAPRRLHERVPDRRDAAILGLVYRGRALCEHAFMLKAGPIVGVVADDRLRPTPSWDGVATNRALARTEAAVAAAAGELLQQLLTHLAALPPEHQAWARATLLRAAAGSAEGGPVPLPEAIEAAPLVAARGGPPVPLAALRRDADARRPIEYVPSDWPGSGEITERVLELDDDALADLQALFGDDALVDASERLLRASHLPALERLPPAPERPALRDDAVLISEAIHADGADGVVGLARAGAPGLVVELCTLGRHLGAHTLPAEQPLRALFFDPKLPLTYPGTVDLKSKRVAQLARWCRRRFPALVAAAVARWEALSASDRRALWEHMRRFFVDAALRDGRRGAASWRAIAALPLFPTIDGRELSVDALRDAAPGDRPLRWMTDVPADAGSLPAAERRERPILHLREDQRACLSELFTLERFDDGWARYRDLQRELVDAPELEPGPPKDALADRRSTASGALDCVLWLPAAATGDLVVDFGVRDRVLFSAPASPRLPCAGIVRGVELAAAMGEGPQLSPRQWTSLEKQVAGLYESLCAKLQSGRLAAAQRPLALRYLKTAALGLDRAEREGESHPALARLRRRIDDVLPRWADALDAGASARGDDAGMTEETHPPEREVTVEEARWSPSAAPERAGAPAPVAAPAPANPARAGADVPAHLELDALDTPDDAAEAELLRALIVQLRLARSRRSDLLSELNLSRLVMGERRGDAVATATGRAVEVNRRHPLVRLALARAGRDPVTLGALASAIYTVINWEAEAIVDDDERAFLGALAACFGASTPG